MEEEFLLLLIAKWHDAFNSSQMRRLRDNTDPFDLPNKVFIKHFILPKSMCCSVIEDLLPHDKQETSLPLALRFLATLNFYATGSFQKRVGNNVLDLSQSTVSRALASITELLVQQKGDEICFPSTDDFQLVVKEGYKEKCGIDNVVGSIGTAQINLLMPTEKRGVPAYLNVHGEYSVKIEAICDHRLMFTSLNARSIGSQSNSEIWQYTSARRFLMSQHNSCSQDTWLLGDATYPLEPWLLTPVTDASTSSEEAYNKKHGRAYDSIKLAFGLLRTRFKCLSKKGKLYYTHERAANIVYACAILHNILLKYGVGTQLNRSELETLEEDATARDSGKAAVKNVFVDGTRVRQRYTQSL